VQKTSRACAAPGCAFNVWFDPGSMIPTLTQEHALPTSFTSWLSCENPAPHTLKYRITIANDEPTIGDPVA
jgi:hypothetical protein